MSFSWCLFTAIETITVRERERERERERASPLNTGQREYFETQAF
jgi:hypothetical protein